MRELILAAPKCPFCRGIVPSQALSIDHKERVQDGGASTASNAQLTHPHCNTGYKEMKHAKRVSGVPKQSKEFEAFTGLMDRLLAVPHAEIKKRIEKHRAESDKNPRKRGPKPKKS